MSALYAISVRQARDYPLEDLLPSKIRLSLDSALRWTPLSLANPSRYWADSGLSPYRMRTHRAHINHGPVARYELCSRPFFCRLSFEVGFKGKFLAVFEHDRGSPEDSHSRLCHARERQDDSTKCQLTRMTTVNEQSKGLFVERHTVTGNL